MKRILILAGALLLLEAGLAAGEVPAGETGRRVDLRVDSSPVESGAPAVASYAGVLDRIRPAVVSVYSTKYVVQRTPDFPYNDPLFRYFFGPGAEQGREEHGLGSGVIVSSDGYIITNNHVVDGADALRVLLPDDREFEAELIGADPKTDVAVIRIAAENLPVATVADSDRLRVGDIVFALGNPLNVGQTVTMGIVSATGRSSLNLIEQGYESFIQTDASINVGNSGGPLVDAMGRVVGINTAILSTSRGNIGIGFAVPINLAGHVMQGLVRHGRVTRGYLGIDAQPLDGEMAKTLGLERSRGAIINDVVAGSPAAEAGLEHGDVVLAINGREIDSFDGLRLAVAQTAPGSTVEIRLFRNGEELTVPVTLGTLPEELEARELMEGVFVAAIDDELRERYGFRQRSTGVVVIRVEADSRYAGALPEGTLLEEINRQTVENAAQAAELIRPGRNLFLITYRGLRSYIAVLVE